MDEVPEHTTDWLDELFVGGDPPEEPGSFVKNGRRIVIIKDYSLDEAVELIKIDGHWHLREAAPF